MEQPLEFQQVFRCARCQHVESETVPQRKHCPRCGLAIPDPRTERERVLESRRLELRLMTQRM